jgi:hypothetical protein
MWGKPKCAAIARAMVPLPLAAGPSTAMTNLRLRAPFAALFDAPFLAKPRALTGAYRYGKAPAAIQQRHCARVGNTSRLLEMKP